jgi:hypothetical protein
MMGQSRLVSSKSRKPFCIFQEDLVESIIYPSELQLRYL